MGLEEVELKAQLAVLRSTVDRLKRENSDMRDREIRWSHELSRLRRELDAGDSRIADWIDDGCPGALRFGERRQSPPFAVYEECWSDSMENLANSIRLGRHRELDEARGGRVETKGEGE